MLKITDATLADLPALIALEQASFSPAEAGTPAAFRERIVKLHDTFLVAKDHDRLAGFVVGPAVNEEFVEDWMYDDTPANLPTGGHQLVLSIAVAADYRGQGVGSQLLAALEQKARTAKRTTISLDSLAKNVPFYEKNGFRAVKVSPSSHANETWHSLVKELE